MVSLSALRELRYVRYEKSNFFDFCSVPVLMKYRIYHSQMVSEGESSGVKAVSISTYVLLVQRKFEIRKIEKSRHLVLRCAVMLMIPIFGLAELAFNVLSRFVNTLPTLRLAQANKLISFRSCFFFLSVLLSGYVDLPHSPEW
jgi:hypothetical protein